MVTKNDSALALGDAIVYIGTAGSTAATPVGILDADDEITTSINAEFLALRDRPKPQRRRTIRLSHDFKISGMFSQWDTTLQELVFNTTASGSVITLPDKGLNPQISAAVEFYLIDGTSVARFDMLRCSCETDAAFSFTAGELAKTPFTFANEGDSDDSEAPKLDIGSTAGTITLSSGVATRVQTLHYIHPESGTTDDLDSIGGSRTDDEITIIKLADPANDTITVKHLNDTLELTGDVEWAMTNRGDALILQYDADNTKDVEIGRIDARSA